MRKSAILLAIFYMLNAVGYGLEVHYCLGQIADINYAFLDTSCVCDENPSEVKRHNCCNDETFFIQIDDAHQATSIALSKNTPFVFQNQCLNKNSDGSVVEITLQETSLRAPPKPVKRTILYHSLIFYA